MSGLRVLLTNVTLATRTGTELFARDLALGLRQAGHRPSVYTPDPGEMAEELRATGVPVTDDLDAIEPPEIIHGQHSLPCLTALTHYPDAPAVFVVHDRVQWTDAPPEHPRIRRYVAVDDNCRERLLEAGIPESRMAVIRNAVDLERFMPRGALPPRPRRALVFSNYVTGESVLPAVREACRREGIEVDVAGRNAGNPVANPEQVLGDYDLVFAKARCALEALAVGCAVILCDLRGVGGLVTPPELDRLRRLNFGMRTLVEPVTVEVLQREIRRYDASTAAAVSERMRDEAALPDQVEAFVALYREVLAEPRVAQPIEEGRAVAVFLASLFPPWGKLDALYRQSLQHRDLEGALERAREEAGRERERAGALARERDAARTEAQLSRAERDREAAEARALKESATWRLRGVVVRTPLARLGRSLARRLTGKRATAEPLDAMPVIVGVPRSGATLLRTMLDAHPQLAIPPETGFLPGVARLPEGPGSRDAIFRAIRSADNWRDFGLAEKAIEAERERLPEDARADAVRAFYRLYARRFGKPRWGEKTAGYGLHMEAIAALLPEAHFVHVIRDGRDVALSVRGLSFAPGDTMAEIARDWCRRIEETRAQGARCPRYLEVRYESLMLDPEATLRVVTAFADLPFDPCQLAYPVPQVSDAGRVGFWREAMSADERAAFESVAGAMLHELGYDVEP